MGSQKIHPDVDRKIFHRGPPSCPRLSFDRQVERITRYGIGYAGTSAPAGLFGEKDNSHPLTSRHLSMASSDGDSCFPEGIGTPNCRFFRLV
jgi:hypothetical protein